MDQNLKFDGWIHTCGTLKFSHMREAIFCDVNAHAKHKWVWPRIHRNVTTFTQNRNPGALYGYTVHVASQLDSAFQCTKLGNRIGSGV